MIQHRPWARPSALLLALAGCLAHASAVGSSVDAAQAELLRNAQMWASKGRMDLARQNIDKLLAIDPDAPEGLAALGDIALRENNAAQARRILERLRAHHPQHSATADLATLVRVYGPDQEKLARMRLMARAGRKAEAAEVARELFPDGPPTVGGLGLEYYQIVGSNPRTGTQASAELARLYRQTGDPNYRLAQIELQMARGAPAPGIARELESLAEAPGVNLQSLRDLWHRVLERLDSPAALVPRLQAYVRRYPDDAAATERLAAARQAVARQEQLARDPIHQARIAARKALDGAELEQAEQALQTILAQHPHDAEGLGGLGLVRLRQQRHAQAQELFEQAYHASPQKKWQDLQATARFNGLLQQADAAAQGNRLDEAADLAAQALALRPNHDDALVTLAGIKVRQDDLPRAQALYEQALQATPAHQGALRGLASILTRTGRTGEALALLERAEREHPGQVRQFAGARADILSSQAEARLAAQQPGVALRLLESALQLTPEDPWLRHRLARVYLQLDQRREALDVMDEGIAAAPGDTDMRYARALIRSATNDDAGALADLEHISPELRSDSMRALLRSATVHSASARALAMPSGAQADALLAQAERQAGDDADLLFAVANTWFKRGQPAQGVAVFDRLAQRVSPLPPAVRLEHAALLGRAQDDPRLSALLPGLLATPGWTPAQDARLLTLQADHLERLTEAALAAGDAGQARRLAQSPLHKGSVPPGPQAYARARLLAAAGAYPAATDYLREALQTQGDSPDVRMALGNALARQGLGAPAREQALWLTDHLPEDDTSQQLALLRLWQRIPAMDEARALAQRLLRRAPDDTDVLLHAARLERADSRYTQAVAYFQQALGQPAAQENRAKIEQELHAIEARRQAWVEFGHERLQKSSTSGISTLRGWERPAVAWMPRGYDGHYFLHVDQIHLDAGPLPSARSDAITYGQVGAWPESTYPAAPGAPKDSGANIGFGYRGDGIEWDVGATGVGFPVTNLVGGIAQSGSRDRYSYKLELSRRPLTGSLLAYAGARDPITGQVWGGVVATGVSGRISTDLGPYSASLSGSYALLQGRNVRDNTRLQLRGAVDRDVLRTPHSTVNVGAALALWSYARDLSEFSWGHGGYYSPRRYASLSLPVEWSGRKGALTWLLRGAVSVSHSSSQASDYYPTSPALQAQAQALGRAPLYAGGQSSGFGRSLRGAVEYQATRQWALGAQLDLDRSAYYAPTTLLLYARILLDPVRAPLQDRPRPVQPYSSF